MSYQGDIHLGDTIDIKFTTRQISGAPFTLAGSPVISAYVDNGTTEITAGITLTVDFDGRTGLNNVRVVASGGNGFAAATNVQLVITTGTVNSVSVVGEVIGEFSIDARTANVKYWNGTVVATPATAGIPEVNVKNWNNLAAVALPLVPTVAGRALDVSVGGEAGLDWANIGSPTTAQGLTGTTISTTQVVASVSGAVGSVTGNVGGNVNGSVASVTAGVSVTTNGDKTGYTLTAGGYDAAADALLDRADAIETAWTVRKVLRIMAAAMGGKASGAATNSPVYRNITDTKARITATTDASGNRTAVTLDGT